MAKFNSIPTATSTVSQHPAATTNHEGGLAFALDAKTRLYTRVATSLVGEKKFYQEAQSHDSAMRADVREVAKTDPEFVLRLAGYVRQELHLRSVPVLLLVEAANIPACKPFVRKWTPIIVQRADEITEVVSCWVSQHGNIGSRGLAGGAHAFPNSLKKGLADAFRRFDEYQLAKYDRKGEVTLGNVLRIIHAMPEDAAQAALFRYLITDEISDEYLPKLAAKARLMRKQELDAEALSLAGEAHITWEVLTSHFGSSVDVWSAAVPFMGYMAKLRNLRNFVEKGVSLEPILSHLTNANAIRNSKQLPFRFFAAYREIDKLQGLATGEVLSALSQALTLSTVNLPRLSGTSFIAADNSGSMDNPLSGKSVRYADVANLLCAISHTMCERSIPAAFATDVAPVNLDRTDSIMANMKKVGEADTKGWSTNAYRCLQWLRENNHHVDRIILLSDMQCYDDGSFEDRYAAYAGTFGASLARELQLYRSQVNPNVFVHSVDLAGYGTSQFAPDCPKVALWAGWSERVLEAMTLFEEDSHQAVARIAGWLPRKAAEADSGSEPLEA